MHGVSANIWILFLQGLLALAGSALAIRAMLLGSSAGPASLRHTVACCLPIAAAAGTVAVTSGIPAAITLLFACCMTALLFGMGAALLVARPDDPPSASQSPKPLPQRPGSAVATMVLPLGCLIMVVGFKLQFTQAALIALSIIGVMSIELLRGESPALRMPPWRALAGFLIALLPLALVGWSSRQILLIHPSILKGVTVEIPLAGLLAPALLLPALRLALKCSHHGDTRSSVRLLGSIATCCIGLMLPALVAGDYFWQRAHSTPEVMAAMASLPPVAWRLDGSMLLVCGFAMVGLRFEMLKPSAWLAFVHLVLYGAYLLAGTILRMA